MNEQALQAIHDLVRAACAAGGADPAEVAEVAVRPVASPGALRPGDVCLEEDEEGRKRVCLELHGTPAARREPDPQSARAVGCQVGKELLEALGLAGLPVARVALDFPANGVVTVTVTRYVTVGEAGKITSGPLPVLGSRFGAILRGKVEEGKVAVMLE